MKNNLISQQCSNLLTYDNFEDIANTYKFLQDWGLNKIGLYHQCLESPQNSYFLIHGQYDLFEKQFISGLCFSSNCTGSDVSYIFRAVNTYLQLQFQSFEVVDVKDQIKSLSVGFYLTTGILLTLILLVIIATLLQSFKIKNPIENIFSISNLTKIIRIRDQKMRIVHGLKFLCFIGIFSIHQLQLIVDSFQTNLGIESETEFAMFFILNYAVDCLFFLNSFAYVYSYLVQFKKKNFKTIRINYLQYFIVYYPLYLLGLALIWFVLEGLQLGPYYYLIAQYTSNQCSNSWIQDVLLISNLTNTKNCNVWLWILQVQFQTRLLISIFMYVYIWIQGSRLQILFKWAPLVISIFLLGLPLLYWNPQTYLNDKMFHFDNMLQINPITHLSAYALGFFAAIYFYKLKKNYEQRYEKTIQLFGSHIVAFLLVFISIILITAPIFYFYIKFDQQIGYLDLLFLQLLHFLLPLATLLLAFRTLLGFRTFLRYFVLQRFFTIGSKLILPGCIISHYLIQVSRLFSKSTEVYYDFSTFIFTCVSNFFLTLLLSLVLGISVYMPLTILKCKLYYKQQLE